MQIIGLCGEKGSGKDTFANYLVDKYQFIRLSFASPLKNVLSVIFGWRRDMLEGDSEQSRIFRETMDEYWGISPREAMTKVGTDLFRNQFDEAVWVRCIERKIQNIIRNNKNNMGDIKIVVTDCRFPNEITMLRNICSDFKLICIRRIDNNSNNITPTQIQQHISEHAWKSETFDYVFINDKNTIDAFNKKIERFIRNQQLWN